MKASRALCLGGLACLCLLVLPTARADEFQDHVKMAIAKLDAIDKLIDGIAARQAAGGVAAVETMKCPACGMQMSTVSTNPNFRAVKIKGKMFFCCTGCNMSKIVDKN